MQVGVVTGLHVEAEVVRRHWPGVAVESALGAERAAAAARALVERGCNALMSFGTAGGLARGLAPGTLVVPTRVVDGHGGLVLPGGEAAAVSLAAAPSRLVSVAAPLMDVEAKTAAAERYAAAVVDMESAAVARVAMACCCGALVVRAIADPADRRLPRLAGVAVDGAGRLRPRPIAWALLAYPQDWPAVARAARDAAAARASLGRAAARLAVFARQGLLERFFDVPVEDVDGGPLLGEVDVR